MGWNDHGASECVQAVKKNPHGGRFNRVVEDVVLMSRRMLVIQTPHEPTRCYIRVTDWRMTKAGPCVPSQLPVSPVGMEGCVFFSSYDSTFVFLYLSMKNIMQPEIPPCWTSPVTRTSEVAIYIHCCPNCHRFIIVIILDMSVKWSEWTYGWQKRFCASVLRSKHCFDFEGHLWSFCLLSVCIF